MNVGQGGLLEVREFRTRGTGASLEKTAKERREKLAEKKIVDALGKYLSDYIDHGTANKSAASMMLYPDAIHMNPQTIAGAFVLIQRAKSYAISPDRIFLQVNDQVVNIVINNIIPPNLKPTKRAAIELSIKVDLLRYIIFITNNRIF